VFHKDEGILLMHQKVAVSHQHLWK